MAIGDDQDANFYATSSAPGPSRQPIVFPSTSQLAESTEPIPRPSSLNMPAARNSRSAGPQLLNVTPKLENTFWARYMPLVETLEKPVNQYLHIDVAYKGCIQQILKCQEALSEKNLSRNEIDDILDNVEKELWHAQHLAVWKRGVLLAADQSLYKVTGRKCDPKHENLAVVKAKKKCKKTPVAVVKENIRRSKRERSSPCSSKIKPKDIIRSSSNNTPRQNSSVNIPNPVRAKRKTKRRESTSESITSNKKRSSGRVTKLPRKKQATMAEACEVPPVNISDEPTYCLCKQVSFGDMIGCDNDKCTVEWFHFGCVQLKSKPKGKWYCPLCRGDRTNILRTPSVK